MKQIVKSHIGITLATLLALGGPAMAAETAYVSGDLAISLRKTAEGDSPALRGLKTGTPFTILEKGKESGFTRIRTEDGLEGWIQSRHITSTNPLAQLTEAQATIEALRAELAQRGTGIDSGATAELEKENGELKAQISQLQQALQKSKEPSLLPEDRETRRWFLTGAGVMLTGIVLGIFLPSLRRKRSSWGDL